MRKMAGAGALAVLALVTGPAVADNAKPRGGGSGGGSSSGSSHHPSGGSSSASSQSSSSGSSGSSSGSSSSSSSHRSGPSTAAQARHPRPGTGTGYRYPGCCYGGGYYPGYSPWYPWYYPTGYAYGPYWGSYYYGYWPYGAYYSLGVQGGGGYSSGGGGSESGGVRLMADPDDARVYVDGYYAGKVEDFDGMFQRLSLGRGRHEILVKKDGYVTRRFRVYSEPGVTFKIEADLDKGEGEAPLVDLTRGRGGEEPEYRPSPGLDSPSSREEWEGDDTAAPTRDRGRHEESLPADQLGQVRLSVRPGDATVYVDGEFRGTAREAGVLVLRPGFHRIEVVRPGYRTESRDVEVRPGETREADVELSRP